ncbi:hypothetical protein AAC387_Pa06g1225 [Persea americana]
MATLTHAESRRLYSWWWDSHISPKNSKWLQENLTDMDVKVKAMIKLIEEDADSFARRAEMYYKKRPELMKLVEEFYRAYRALAERYDHATGALRQAHRTMAEAFPNQIPFVDDSPSSSLAAETEPHTPKMSHPIRALLDPDDLQKDSLGVSSHFQAIKKNGAYPEDNVAVTSKKGLKQLNEMFTPADGTDHARFAEGRVRKGLQFQEDNRRISEVTAQNIFSRDVQKHKLEEIDGNCIKISSLQDEVSQLSTDNQNLRTKVLAESERADKARNEVGSLQQILSKLESDKEAAVLQYQQCLEKLSSLEAEISRRQAEVSKLNGEIVEGATRLKATEERLLLLEKANQSLQLEVDSLMQGATAQQQELMKKNEELEKLNVCIQDERTHLMCAEAALQSLRSLHSQSQEEQRILALELQHGVQKLKDMEFRKQCLEEEIQRFEEENLTLNEQNRSSAMSIKNLQDEIFSLKEVKGKLEEEVGLRVDERNALQQELYSLRGELNDLDRRHQDVIEQVESVGLNASCLRTSIKELQDENLKLKEICRGNEREKAILSEKLENMEKLLEKNALLENFLSDASAEMEGLRERLKTLQESFQSLQGEKLTLVAEKCLLVSQVESITQNIEKLSEKNSMLENSLSDVNVELEGLRAKAKNLEDSCQVLQDEKSSLVVERNGMVSQVETIRQCLENLEKTHAELAYKHSCLEKERESALRCVDELQLSLNLEKQEHATYFQTSQTQLATLGNQLHLLQEESQWRKRQFEEEQDKVMSAEIEIFVLQRCIHDMRVRNLSLSFECLEHIEASMRAKKLISELEQEILEQKMKVDSLQENNEQLRTGIHWVLKSLNIDVDDGCPNGTVRELFSLILGKVQALYTSVFETEDEKLQLLFEKIVIATLLEQLRLDASDLKAEKHVLEQESETTTKELLMLQSEKHELLKLNDQLSHDVYDGSHRVELLTGEVGILQVQLSDSQEAYQMLQKENCMAQDDNQFLKKEIYDVREENNVLEEENCSLLHEATNLGNLSLIFESISSEKAAKLKTLIDELDHLHGVCSELDEVRVMAERVQAENLSLNESIAALEKFRSHSLMLENELNKVRIASEQLNYEVETGKNHLSQKEIELSEAYQKLKAEEFEREDLHKRISELELRDEQLNSELEKFRSRSLILEDELNGVRIVSQQLNHEVETGKNQLSLKEMELSQAYQKLKDEEFEREELHKEISELKLKDEQLNAEVQEKMNEVKLLEEEAASLYEDLQIRSVCLALFEEKASELIGSCKCLEENAMIQEKMFNDDKAKTTTDNKELKEKICALERENGGLKAELNAYLPLILSLKEGISSLEDQTHSLTKVLVTDSQETQDAAVGNLHDVSGQGPTDANDITLSAGVVELQKLQTQVRAVEKAMIEMRRLSVQGSADADARLEAAIKEIEELKSKNSLVQERDLNTNMDVVSLQVDDRKPRKDVERQNDEADISKAKHELMMKDIQLDHASDSSSYENGVDARGVSRSGKSEGGDQMLELWEAAEQDYKGEPSMFKRTHTSSTFDDVIEYHEIEAVEEQKSEYPSSELQVEKELAVDKLEVPNKVSELKREGNKKILERLASDTLRLTNLQASAQELKTKFEKSEKANQLLGFEYDTVKAQLKEVNEAISQLVDVNKKLTKNVEDISRSGGKAEELEKGGNMRRRQVAERARRWSEKIGRLELEVQRIQFVMVKLESEYGHKGSKAVHRRTKVVLRDYLYGVRESRRRKKAHLCACARPSTKGD